MLAEKAISLVREVKENLNELMVDWRSLQQDFPVGNDSHSEHTPVSTTNPIAMLSSCSKLLCQQQSTLVTVQRTDLDKLATETMMLKEFLPKILTADFVGAQGRLTQQEQELWALRKEREELEKTLEYMKRRNDTLKTDYEQEKKEKFALKCEVNDLQQQLSQQADYCTSMGAACCTLLWRVSRQEECIHSILSGSKVSDFLQLGACTLQSYLDTYSTDSLPDESSLESQFVLALCGTVTNVAASAYGRDFLSSSKEGLALVDVFCTALTEAPAAPECSKLRRLMLMTLYNISINQKGLQYLTSKPDFMRVLTWKLKDESDATNCVHIMRVLQSLIMEPESMSVVHQALEAIPLSLLEHFTKNPNKEVCATALELMSDVHSLQSFSCQQ